jgi:hypothetical protein
MSYTAISDFECALKKGLIVRKRIVDAETSLAKKCCEQVKVLIVTIAAIVLMWVAEIGMFKLPAPFKLPEY